MRRDSSRSRRRTRWRIACLAALGFGPIAPAAQPPGWVSQAVVSARAEPWRTNARAELILKSTTVHFVSPDLQHIAIDYRGIVHWKLAGTVPNFASVTYGPNTGRIVSASAWLLRPDGTVAKSFRLGDFTDVVALYSSHFWQAQRRLVLEAARSSEAGNYLAWDIRYEEQSGFSQEGINFLEALPCLRQEFEAIPAAGGKIVWHSGSRRIGPPAMGAEAGALKWTVLKETLSGPERPNGFLPNPLHLVVRCVPQAASSPAETWSDLSRQIAALVDPQIDAGGAVAAEAARRVEGKTARWDRIRALTEFVQKDIVYLAIDLDRDSLEGCRPHPSAEVLRNRYGDCKDKATLLISMLRAVGEDGRGVLLDGANDPAYVDSEWPADYFNHVIVAIPADAATPAWWPTVDLEGLGKFVIFDPTDPETPLGVLSQNDQAGYGLLVDSKAGQIFRLPKAEAGANRVTFQIRAVLDAAGTVAASAVEECHGNAAAAAHLLRNGTTREQFQVAIERRLDGIVPGVALKSWSDTWEPAEARYVLHYDYGIPDYAPPMSDGIMSVAPNPYERVIELRPWRVRNEGQAFIPSEDIDNEVRMTLPAGYKVDELPDPWKLAGKAVNASLDYRVEGAALVFTSHVERRSGLYDRPEYEEIRRDYRKMAEAVKRPILLVRIPAPAAPSSPPPAGGL